VFAFSTQDASIGVKYADEVVKYFEDLLVEELEKAGLVVEEKPTEPQPDHVLVEGHFRMIDAGNRFFRWLFAPFTQLAGATLWVQGTCSVGEEKVSDFDVRVMHGGGLYALYKWNFGGKDIAVLERCAGKAANKVAREVVGALSEWLAEHNR
jgi:hypothetical protein